jgi:sterol desaturase/sphingolipid hydroxylase (fatty acid hydroxylase superfamily)
MPDLTHYAIPAFLALMLGESCVAAWRGRRVYEARDTAASLAMGVGNVLIQAAWKGVAFGFYWVLYQHRLFELGTGAAAWILVFVAEDFAYYWFHRGSHEVRLFWAAHVNHHSSQRYNLSTALRQSWTTPFTSMCFYWPLPLLGFHPALFMTATAVSLLYQFWIHTEQIDRLGPLEWVLNTPSHHRVHHGANVEYLDRNYGGILIVWDRLFGSFEPEGAPVRYGLTKNLRTYDPVRIAFHEWAALARDVASAPTLSERAALCLRPPGWSRDGSTRTARAMRAALVPAAERTPPELTGAVPAQQ